MSTDLETNLLIIEEFTQRLQVAVIGAEETTDKHVNWVEGPVDGTIETANGPLKTLRGQIAEWRLSADQDVASAINGYDAQFAAKLVEFQAEFEAYLITIGFEPAVEYAAGIVISRRAQTVVFGGVTYYWVSTLPYTTTGSFGTETGWQIAPIVGGIEVPTFNFSTGGKLLRKTQSVLGLDGEWYFWTGPFPKTIVAGSTLESAGGVGQNLFKIASGYPPLRPTMNIVVTSIGLTLNEGSFEGGATLVNPQETLVQFLTGKIYKWNGALPKVVDLFSTPNSSGGITSGAWEEIQTSFTQNISIEALRRSYAEAGYNLIGTFRDTGLVVNTTTDVALWGPTGVVYAYGGTLPHTIVAAETPIGNPLWVDKSGELLRNKLAASSGSALIGIPNGRTQADKNADVISVLDEGATANSTNGLDGADSTAAFLSAITKCVATGKSISIPKASGGYRLTQTVDFRGLNVIESDAPLYINHAGIGVIFGGNASNPNNPRQSFGTVTRVTGVASRTTPDMRGIGVKGQHIRVEKCDYLQVYASGLIGDNPTDYSSAYSSYWLKNVYTLELLGELEGWINENYFKLDRTNKILFADGPYSHNHNIFHRGTMEGLGVIDLPIGNNNKFYGFRFERAPSQPSQTLTINFGTETWDNSVQASWVSSPRYTNDPYNPNNMVTVTDEGQGNSVYNIQDLESDERVLFDLSPSTPFLSSINAGLVGTLNQNTDMDGVRYVKSLARGKFRCITSNAGMYSDGRIFEFRNGDKIAFTSDQTLFRPLIYLYDANGNALVNEPTDDILSLAGKIWSNGAYTLGANVKSFSALFKKVSQAKYFRVSLNFGNATAGIDFEYARLTMRMPKNSTGAPRKGFDVTTPSRVPSLPYFNSSDVSMANIGVGVTCYKTDMTEMKVNLLRHRYSVLSVVGNVITILGGSVQYFDLASCFVVYTDSAGSNLQLAVSSISASTITLSAPPPGEIVVGANIDFIITKTKLLT